MTMQKYVASRSSAATTEEKQAGDTKFDARPNTNLILLMRLLQLLEPSQRNPVPCLKQEQLKKVELD